MVAENDVDTQLEYLQELVQASYEPEVAELSTASNAEALKTENEQLSGSPVLSLSPEAQEDLPDYESIADLEIELVADEQIDDDSGFQDQIFGSQDKKRMFNDGFTAVSSITSPSFATELSHTDKRQRV